jgi:hypothetical protein
MIANALRVEIERYAARMPTENPLFSKAADGTFTPTCMVTYLTNLKHLLAHTGPFLTQARKLALASRDERLASHYEHKMVEEIGHETWADRDIERISTGSLITASATTLPSLHTLLTFLRRTIDEDPALYLSYILFVEYITVLLGPAWLSLLEERCGIPRSSMTVIGNHVEADREHVEEALDQIDLLVPQPHKLPRMREVLLESFVHFNRFCAEAMTDLDSNARASDATPHVSAA